MKFQKIIFVFTLIIPFYFMSNAQIEDDIFTIYLVRHAEKDFSTNNYTDPPLTECGKKRAESLATFFKDVNLEAIYSSDYTRTKNTAQPTANNQELDITIYAPNELEGFSKKLLNCKQDALVVGHSNTTGVLAGLLIDENIGAFSEDIYNRIYQVVITKNTGRLHLFSTSFVCEK